MKPYKIQHVLANSGANAAAATAAAPASASAAPASAAPASAAAAAAAQPESGWGAPPLSLQTVGTNFNRRLRMCGVQ